MLANQITTWNKVMFAIVVILLIMVATYLLYKHYNANGLVLGQLSTGDMARLTDEQRYTLDTLENKVFTLSLNDERRQH